MVGLIGRWYLMQEELAVRSDDDVCDEFSVTSQEWMLNSKPISRGG